MHPISETGDREALLARAGLSVEGIVKQIRDAVAIA
jgi:hypothetical protein